MNFLLDVNVLIAIAWPNHVSHPVAHSWFRDNYSHGWVTSPVTESGFIRLSSNPKLVSEVVTPNVCAQLLESLKKVGVHREIEDNINLSKELASTSVHLTGHRQVTDAHLALLGKAQDCTLVTLDSGAANLAKSLGAESLLVQAW